jgi:hypothetical protein
MDRFKLTKQDRINQYKIIMYNVKGDLECYTRPNIVRRLDKMGFFDAPASIIMLQNIAPDALTNEEIACIRWHMGAFDDRNNWEYYTRAVAKFPNVMYTHAADMAAAYIVGV